MRQTETVVLKNHNGPRGRHVKGETFRSKAAAVNHLKLQAMRLFICLQAEERKKEEEIDLGGMVDLANGFFHYTFHYGTIAGGNNSESETL